MKKTMLYISAIIITLSIIFIFLIPVIQIYIAKRPLNEVAFLGFGSIGAVIIGGIFSQFGRKYEKRLWKLGIFLIGYLLMVGSFYSIAHYLGIDFFTQQQGWFAAQYTFGAMLVKILFEDTRPKTSK